MITSNFGLGTRKGKGKPPNRPIFDLLNNIENFGTAIGATPETKEQLVTFDPLEFTNVCQFSEEPLPQLVWKAQDVKTDRPNRLQTYIKTQELLDELPEVQIRNTFITLPKHEQLIVESNGIVVDKIDSQDGSKFGTLDDPRLGTIDSNKCGTCRQSKITCPGHLGIIFLPHIISPLPTMIRDIIRVLNCVCGSCGVLKLSRPILEKEGVLNLKGQARLQHIEKMSKNLTCTHKVKEIGAKNIAKCLGNFEYQSKKSQDKGQITYRLPNSTEDKVMTAKEVFDIMDAISDEDAELLGFGGGNHPRDMILRSIAVIPPCARPPAQVDGKTYSNDLTKSYEQIIKELNKFKLSKLGDKERGKKLERLTKAVGQLMGISDKKNASTHKNNKGVRQLISGKKGLIRKNLFGKRVNTSARTVASTDVNIRFGQIGVPKYLAKYLVKKVIVNSENIDFLHQLYEEGQIVTIVKKNYKGKVVVNEESKKKLWVRPEIGDTVYRWLQNGDYVMFNRNPTLSRQSFMSAEAVISDRNTADCVMLVSNRGQWGRKTPMEE